MPKASGNAALLLAAFPSIVCWVDGSEASRVRRLPPGPHGLPPDLVERNQRERLIAAMAEECAERGYAETSVAEIARRAGVSTASFYRQFKDRRECMLASFAELSGRLIEAIEGGCAGEADPARQAKAGTRTAAELLAGDLPTTRLLTVEIVAVGPEGVRAQQAAIERLAVLLRRARGMDGDSPVSVPGSAEWTAVAAMVALVARRVVEGESSTGAELEAVLDNWLNQ
jgi:AcrR family transcriptional regulator